jgi:hypothetical protein
MSQKVNWSTNYEMGALGVFSTPSYLSVGDEFDKPQDPKARHKGKQFLTNPTRRGKVGHSVTFDAFKPLFEVCFDFQ